MPHSMRLLLQGLVLSLGMMFGLSALAAQEVRVGGAHFPPYVLEPRQEQIGGLLPELLEALNQAQSDYRFVLVPTSIKRRFRDFEQGRIDMAIFENPEWGWQTIPHGTVDMGLEDAEVFVGRQVAGRDQGYFNGLAGKRLALYSGYHYQFAGFKSEPKFFSREFNATLTYSHDSNLLMILKERADIALVTRYYLGDFFQRHGAYQRQLLVSERIDQHYRHHALLRPHAPIGAPRFRELLEQLRRSGQLNAIFDPYQIVVTPSVVAEPAP